MQRGDLGCTASTATLGRKRWGGREEVRKEKDIAAM